MMPELHRNLSSSRTYDILKITEPQGEMEVLLKNKEEKAKD